jgi:hypothetical protein
VRPKVSMALDAWRKLRRGEAIDLASAKAMYSFMRGNGARVARGSKTIRADAE